MQIIILIKIHYNVRDYYIIFYKLNFRFFFHRKIANGMTAAARISSFGAVLSNFLINYFV